MKCGEIRRFALRLLEISPQMQGKSQGSKRKAVRSWGGDDTIKFDFHKYALECQEETGLYYLPRGEMPTKIPKECILATTKLCTQFARIPGSVVFKHGFKSRATATDTDK